jgi:sec-independent protein translocase protein TatB
VNFSPEKLFLVGIIALVVLGPNRLPHAARTAGRLLAEFRRVSANLQSEVTSAIAEPRDALQQAAGEFGLGDVRSSIRNTLNEVVTGATGRPAPGSPNAVSGPVGAPIVDPSLPLEVSAREATDADVATPPAAELPGPSVSPGPAARRTPLPPDDPSLN